MFKEEALHILSIMEDVIPQRSLYNDEEIDAKNVFFDKPYTEEETLIKKKIIKIDIRYHAKLNRWYYDDPKNKMLVDELLKKIDEIKEELKLL
ncbi:hypothetical protein D3P08_23195 [Paenibacillus nanensis]|uniref:Uncharacterized protein n=1 Tax=Paenibacillus nanensis TaxID=393251 RepID=A0A3A1UN46_9BACL|nr:hypothetical protein [Paenibacillus nanensis]RIX49246.1 hypothetical protein D3P08_23195 [Paenibacillus nanensis]